MSKNPTSPNNNNNNANGFLSAEPKRSVLKRKSSYTEGQPSSQGNNKKTPTKAQISATMRAFAETAPPIEDNVDGDEDEDEENDLDDFDPDKSTNNFSSSNKNAKNSSKSKKKTSQPKKKTKKVAVEGDDEGGEDNDLELEEDSLSSSEEGGGASAEGGSHATGSSSSSNTLQKLKSSLPCGLSMTVVMSVIILVPITFLIVYTAIPLAAAVQSLAFLDKHRDLLERCVVCGTHLIDERTVTSRYMINQYAASRANSTNNFFVDHQLTFEGLHQQMHATRDDTDECLVAFLRDARNSDSASQALVLKSAQTLVADLSSLRQSVDDGTITGPDARTAYREIIDEANHISVTVANDDRATVMSAVLITFMLSLRIGNSQGMLLDASIAVVTNYRDFHNGLIDRNDLIVRTQDNLENIFANFVITRRDFLTLEKAAVNNEMADVAKWFNTKSHDLFIGQVNALQDNFGNVTLINSDPSLRTAFGGKLLTVDTLIDDSAEMFRLLGVSANEQRERILKGPALVQARTDEILKMIFAILACIGTAGAAIWLNRKEQARMEAALASSERLSKAVQRFVPKNQLRTMGARSITQVSQNLAVEVAQAILHASLHDFAALSEQMKNMDLFEWLGRFISRMNDSTTQEKGYVNQVFADSVSCVFNAPTNAVNASIEMHVSSEQLNLELVSEKGSNLVSMGIGIHFSVVVVGVQGSESRLSCTTVSSDIGLAPRLESLTSKFDAKIIISDAVAYQLNAENYNMRYLGVTRQDGSAITVEMFEVFDAADLDEKQFKKHHKEEFEDAVRIFEELIFEKDYRESQRKKVELQLQSLQAQKKMYQDRDDEDRAAEVQEEINMVERKMRAESKQQQKLKNKRNENGAALSPEAQQRADDQAVKNAVETFSRLKLMARKDYMTDGGAQYFLERYNARELEKRRNTTKTKDPSSEINVEEIEDVFENNPVNHFASKLLSSPHKPKKSVKNANSATREMASDSSAERERPNFQRHDSNRRHTSLPPTSTVLKFGGQLNESYQES